MKIKEMKKVLAISCVILNYEIGVQSTSVSSSKLEKICYFFAKKLRAKKRLTFNGKRFSFEIVIHGSIFQGQSSKNFGI